MSSVYQNNSWGKKNPKISLNIVICSKISQFFLNWYKSRILAFKITNLDHENAYFAMIKQQKPFSMIINAVSPVPLGQGSATCGLRAMCGSLDVKLRLFSSICKYYLFYEKTIKIVLNRLTRIRHRFYLSATYTRFSLHPSHMTNVITAVSL